MAKSKRPTPITAQDLEELSFERADRQEDHKRLQRFLDDTNTSIDLDQASKQELDEIRKVVDNPAAALAGPNILIWNNICRQRAGLLLRPVQT
ncbi:MAG: hypothetical protein KUG74_10680 [Rhodobacteraceae bacterium]|nr:hypothetical protein [Paracoccaceae bacterium]